MLHFLKFKSYSALPGDEETTVSVEDDAFPAAAVAAPHSKWILRTSTVLLIANVMLFGVSMSITRGTESCNPVFSNPETPNGLNEYLKRTSSYCESARVLNFYVSNPLRVADLHVKAPLLDIVDLNPRKQTFNGKLQDNSSIYRMPPSPAVDAAWDYISTEGLEAITVPEESILRSDKDPTLSVKAPSSWGRGPDAYVVQIDVFHQIHCLNELRKEIYYDYYYTTPPDSVHVDHKSHCIHMLLQNLMCHADVEIVTHNWVHNDRIPDPKDRPFPDFNIVKQCRDFDALLDWARENAVKKLAENWNALRIKPGMKVVSGDGYA